MPTSWRRLFCLGDHVFSLEGNGRALWDWSALLYQAAQIDSGEPQKRFIVEKQDQGVYILWQDGVEYCRSTNAKSFFRRTERALTIAALEALYKYLQIHAGVVSVHSKGWLISGASDAGKTTLSLSLAQAGAELFSDEIALLSSDGLQLWPFRRDLTVHRGTWGLFAAELDALPKFSYRDFGKYAYLSPDLIGGLSQVPVELHQLIFPRWQPDAVLAIRSVGPTETAQRLLAQSLNLNCFERGGVDVIANMASRIPALEIVFGNGREAALKLLSLAVN